jgi:Domain of unknown function (DUF5047)
VWPLSTRARQALVQSHGMAVRATAYGPYGTREIPVGGGSVTSDAGNQVRRTATLETDLSLWPVDPRSILAPLGTEIQLDYGIVLPGGATEWVPLIRGLVDKVNRERPYPRSGVMPLQLSDRALRVAEDRLTSPAQTVAGALVTVEIRRLIQETLGTSVAVTDLTGSTQVAPLLEIERERWADGVEKLADSIGAECFFDPQGSGVIRPQPTLSDPAVWTVDSGPQGLLVARGDELAREPTYSGVVARGERTDGTAPVQAIVWDTDPNSPTYYLGPFGRKPLFYSSPLLTTVAQCQTAGAALLARAKGKQAAPAISTIVNPALEAGDVVLLQDDGRRQLLILDKVTVPLSPRDAQTLQARSLDLGAVV